MKNVIYLLVILTAGVFLWQVATGQDEAPTAVSQSLVMEQMRLHPLAFTENQGQWDDRVLFRANAGGATMWFTKNGVYYQFTRRVHQAARDVVGGQALPDVGGRRPRLPHALIERPGRSGALPRTELALPTVIPAQAGIQDRPNMDTRFRGHDNQKGTPPLGVVQ
ncbi:MAG: hypothetical protein KAT58_02320 [candidate division Zixibacteria bacterium]|nr:hypothetical protein [candidate division Zixibacteria bacterium]